MRKKSKTSPFKKILKTLPVLLSVMAVIYLALFIKDIEFPTVLPVTDVVVKGELNFVSEEEVEVLVKENISGGYFTVDLDNIREIILLKPWVKNVALRREWPASLTVYIEEQIAVAYWNKDAYLGKDGKLFKPEIIDTTLNLPNLNGPSGQHDNVWKFMNVLYKETAMLSYEVIRLNLDDRRAWQLTLAERIKKRQVDKELAVRERDDSEDADLESKSVEATVIEIKLGRFDTNKRLQRFVAILPALIDEHAIKQNNYMTGKIKVIDMRYPNGFAVQFTENCSPHLPNLSPQCKSSGA